jgi:hypothetical protein
MAKYIAIEGDYNDGDYTTEISEITDEQIIKIKEILAKMPIERECIRYETRDIGNDDQKDSNYDFITYEEKRFLSEFLPSGDSNYPGIHTIESVDIFEKLEKIL